MISISKLLPAVVLHNGALLKIEFIRFSIESESGFIGAIDSRKYIISVNV
jgi:hypothetical protein